MNSMISSAAAASSPALNGACICCGAGSATTLWPASRSATLYRLSDHDTLRARISPATASFVPGPRTL